MSKNKFNTINGVGIAISIAIFVPSTANACFGGCNWFNWWHKPKPHVVVVPKPHVVVAPKPKYGKVCGKVFEDSNDNGAFDVSDKRLGNVSVKVTDANGNEQIVKTDTAHGKYCANNVAVGTATVDIIESTLPANAEQVVGTDPTTVEIKANTENWEEYNGYVFADPVGEVCGKVFEDTNDNGAFDKDTDKRLGNVSVKVTDANGNEQIVKTDTAHGKYCANNVAVGTATVDIIESTLPANAEQVVGTDPTTVEIKANTENWEEYNGYFIDEPEPLVGKVCGKVFEDTNENGAFDKDTDKRLGNVSVKVTDANGNEQIVKTDTKYGRYCANNVAVGTATVDIIESTLPANAEQVVGTDPTTVEIKANTTNWEEYNGYVFAKPEPLVGKVCGKVFEDSNDNGAFDKDTDKRLGNVSVKVTDANGNEQIVKTDTKYGRYCADNVAVGTATIDIIESTLPANAEQVVGTDPTTVEIKANIENWEEYNGYVFAKPKPLVGKVD